MIEQLPSHLGSRKSLGEWVAEYFILLDVHGSFAFAWTQAAQEDEEIRIAGMKRHLAICTQVGNLLAQTAGRTTDRPALLGVAVVSVLERTWNYGRLYADTVRRDDVIDELARTLFAMARAQR